jgi:hypothetical protein
MQNVQDMHDLRAEVFRLDGNEKIAPFVEAMHDAKRSQPAQSSSEIQPGTLSGLKNYGEAQKEKDQSVYKVDHGSIEQKEISQSNHGGKIVAYGSGLGEPVLEESIALR